MRAEEVSECGFMAEFLRWCGKDALFVFNTLDVDFLTGVLGRELAR
jgi:hypothetical protein